MRIPTAVFLPLTLHAALACAVRAAEPLAPDGLSSVRSADARIVRVESSPTIDGRLTEPAWDTAEVITGFSQAIPDEGAPPSERTEVRLLYGRDAIYIGVTCFVSDPSTIRARDKRPDAALRAEDAVIVTIDSNGDRRTGYLFEIGAGGAKIDGLIENNEPIGREWDGIWAVKTTTGDDRWTAEMAIPFATIGFDPDTALWGFNFGRNYGATGEFDRWKNAVRNGSTSEVARAGMVEGITDVDPGHGLTLQPFGLARWDGNRSAPGTSGNGWDAQAGLDVYYRLSTETTLAVTINTDFAETEVDDRVVNLTRFPVFFPEQRDFFLQDAGLFRYGGINRSPLPFFSRRIGIVDGEEKDILAGVKLTGREGGLRFGLLSVQMAEDPELGDKNLSVVRLARDVGEQSSLGVIVTNGDPAERGNNTLLGLDWNHREDWNGFRLESSLWAQGTYSDPADREASNDDTTAVGGRLELSDSAWRFSTFLARVGRDYDPALGFVQRTGRVEGVASARRTWNRPGRTIREAELSFFGQVFWLLDGEIDTVDANIAEFTIENSADDQAFVRPFYSHENIQTPFEIVDGVSVPVDRYDTGGAELGIRSSAARPLSIDASVTPRTFYTGTRTDYSVEATLRPGPGFQASAGYFINDVDLDEGDFTVRLARLRANWQISPELSLSATTQWDNQSDEASLNTRLRWEFRPGQELFVVYNEGFDADFSGSNGRLFGGDNRLTSTRQDLTIKVGLTLRY